MSNTSDELGAGLELNEAKKLISELENKLRHKTLECESLELKLRGTIPPRFIHCDKQHCMTEAREIIVENEKTLRKIQRIISGDFGERLTNNQMSGMNCTVEDIVRP